ncbi:LuxR C-terminal-related transcriptional regulator [Flavobacterium sp. JP2137]|uniref:helix-turn-helix transcriptional regulator n=1 Tax=Flavobacterium sp. JP2137 TaxID=3414510 RepID=UPI003D2FA9D2
MSSAKYYQDALAIWKKMSQSPTNNELQLELDVSKKINAIFHVGPYYYYIFDLPSGQFIHVDRSIYSILGIEAESITVASFMDLLHPEDVIYFLNFEQKVSAFFSQLAIDQILNYKVSYDFRIRRADGQYIRILHQVITINHSDEGKVLQTLGIHTDISHIKTTGNPKLSFIGLEGEPSYIDVDYQKAFTPKKETFSIREKEILKHLCEGFTSAEIGHKLFISEHTVNTHRKNILRKTTAKSTTELVVLAVKQGLY